MAANEDEVVATDEWLIVETLGDGPHTVIADGGKIKNWTNIGRARSYGPAASKRMVDAVNRCVATATEQHDVVAATTSRDELVILAVPALAAADRVNGVHLWIGPRTQQPPPKRAVAVWHWDQKTQTNHQGRDSVDEVVLRMPKDEVHAARSAPDNFQRILRFDDRVGYVAMVSKMEPGGRWQGRISMRRYDDTVCQLQMVTRADPRENIARGLFNDISDVAPPEPIVDNAALRMLAAASGIGAGIMDLGTTTIYDWFSTPPSPLDRWQHTNPTIDPDDQTLLTAACARLGTTGAREQMLVRVKFDDTDWIHTDVEITAIGEQSPPQGLIQVSPRH